jgi:hypothetical protein
MQCLHCGLQLAFEDKFCRRCGTATGIIDVPAVAGPARPLSHWQELRPAVTRGVALLAAGALLRFVVGQAGRAVFSRAVSGSNPLNRLAAGGGDRLARRSGEEIEMIWYRRSRR